MADERSRSPRRDIVWVKVKDGNPVRIMLSQMDAPQDVFSLLQRGGEDEGATRLGSRSHWQAPAVPERTCTCKLWDTPSLRPSHEWGQRWRQRQQPSLHIFPWQLGQGFRGVVWVRSNKVFDSPLFLICFPFVGWNFAFEFVVTTATEDLRETDGVPSWLKTCGRTKNNQQKHRSADKQINHQEHYA